MQGAVQVICFLIPKPEYKNIQYLLAKYLRIIHDKQ